MIAIMRNLHPRIDAGLKDHLPVFGVNAFAIDGNLGHRVWYVSGACEGIHYQIERDPISLTQMAVDRCSRSIAGDVQRGRCARGLDRTATLSVSAPPSRS